MDEDTEVTLLDDDEENSNPKPDQNSTDAGVTYDDNFEAASIELTREIEQNVISHDKQDKDREQEDEMAEITKTTTKQKGSELDKFKRRLIRAIARLMHNNQTPTEEIWEELKKQSGCDCKLLWNRMRTLTMKKLRRLFTAEDKIANITKIAQLTVTDWLLFDLVLVHEKIDVIGKELQDPDAEESPKILEDLFATVVVFDLERLEGDKLTKAWFEATTYYNGKVRQCSPMLLQRRWYQMKETVREKFYQFWFQYRGSQRQLAAANEFKPTGLEMEIVKLFKYITTERFPTWEELIQQKKVALPEDFERLQLAKRRIFRTETGPDLEVIEPQVETIDLDQENNSDESRDSTSAEPKTNVDLGVVKTEKVDEISDDDDVRILESAHIPLETNSNAETERSSGNTMDQIVEEHRSTDINNEEDISIVNENTIPIDSIQLNNVMTIKNEHEDVNMQSIDTAEIQDGTDEMLMPRIVASTSISSISSEFDGALMPRISNVTSAAILTNDPVDNAVSNEINGILESVAENFSTKNLFNVPQCIDKTLLTQDDLQNPDTLVQNIIDEELSSRNNNKKGENSLDPISVVPNDVNIFDGIELEDDGIEYVEEEDQEEDVKPNVEIKMEKTDESDCAKSPTIDLKLLLTPVVYTKKLDDMDVFRFIDYNTVEDKRVIENAAHESKPVDRNSVKMEEISQERPTTPDSDAFSDTSEYHSEIDVRPETVSPSSWLLNKLQKLSYNPIQLCKNPDFNTRLKRLSAGFFSYERNRRQLKECKPLTIDLHKSFETKLINNTLYLTRTKPIENKTNVLERNVVGTAEFPSNFPLQNLVDNVISDILGSDVSNKDRGMVQNTQRVEVPSDDDVLGSIPPPNSSLAKNFAAHSAAIDSYPSERNKVINLPDIAQIRRLNERLLTAEVSPIQVTNTTKVPVNIVSVQQGSDIASPNNKILQSNGDIIKKGIESTASSTLSDINCEALSILSKTNLISDVRCQNDIIDATQKALSLDSNTSGTVSKGNSLNRINNQQQKVVKEPKKPARLNRVEVSWSPAPKKMIIPQDRLLTSDTVDKIINLCKGDDNSFKRSKAYQKALRKRALRELEEKKIRSASTEDVSANEVKMNKTSEVYTNLKSVPNQITNEIKNRNKDNITKTQRDDINKKRAKRNRYCCWAREKIIKLGIGNRAVTRHKCPRPLCNCCCRQELVEKMFEINVNREQARSQMSQAEIDRVKKKIKINFAQSPSENSTQVKLRPKVSSKETPLKVSIGINTDFDADFETGFAANLAELNTSAIDSNNSSVSTVKVTYGPHDSQANGQTQTSVNLMILDKNNKNQTLPCINTSQNTSDENASTVSFNESNSCNLIPTANRIVLNRRNPTFSYKESSSPTVSPIKVRLVSDINDPSAKLKKSNSLGVISKLEPSGIDKNKIIYPLTGSNVARNSSFKEFSNIRKNQSQLAALLFDKDLPKITPRKLIRTLTPLSRGGSKVLLEEKGDPLDKILFLTNDKSKSNRTPICLGKNKILLCSFEKPQLKNQPKLDDKPVVSASQDTPPVVTLPVGVRIVLLPNKELALSIDPGVELDSSQLAYLPTLMASIQKQLDEAGNIASSHRHELNKSNLNDRNNITMEKLNESELKSVDKEIENEAAIGITSLTCNAQLIDNADDIEKDIIRKNKTKEGDCDSKKEDSCMLDKNNANAVDLMDDSDTNKKTILSDLMEMSGISAEDTHLTSPTKQQPVVCSPPLIQGLQSQIANQHNAKFMNNPLFNNPVVKTALSRCPELCIVFSYTELRYASENNAQFFKMDIETGVVVPINLVIKKQIQGEKSNKQFTMSKSVIDLTDDPEEDEAISIDEQNAQTLEPQSTAGQGKDRVVPVKLFSTRPSLLRRGKSMLLQSVKTYTNPSSSIKKKKMIRIIQLKRKRKQSMECVASIDLDSDTEQTESTTADANSEAIHEKTKPDHDSDSDDEPLAFKAKRMKDSAQEPAESTDQLNQNTDDLGEKQDAKMVGGDAEEMIIDDENPVDDPPRKIPDETYDHVNPTSQLEPVVFEPLGFGDNNQESSEEDCILGV